MGFALHLTARMKCLGLLTRLHGAVHRLQLQMDIRMAANPNFQFSGPSRCLKSIRTIN